MATTYDIMLNLKEIFGDQGHAGRQVAMKALLNTKMVEGTLVQDYVLKMIAHLNESGDSGSRELKGNPGRYHAYVVTRVF